MASVIKEIDISVGTDTLWDAVRDFREAPLRIAPGLVIDSRLEGADMRVVAFADGLVARERRRGRAER